MKYKFLSKNIYGGALCATMLLIASCDKQEAINDDVEFYNPDEYVEFEYEEPTDTLQVQYTSIINDGALSGYDSIAIFESRERTSDTAEIFIAYDLHSEKELGRFCTRGHASNEIMFPPSTFYLNRMNNDLLLYAYDDMINATKVINVSKSIGEKKCVMASKPILHKLRARYYFQLGKDKTFAYVEDQTEDARDGSDFCPVCVMHDGKNEKRIETIRKSVELKNVIYDQFMYHSHVRMKFDKSKWVTAPIFFSRIDITDMNTGHVLGIREKGSYGYKDVEKFINEQGEQVLKNFLIRYNTSLLLSDDYILLTQNRKDNWFDDSFKSSVLLIFNWEGKLLNTSFIKEDLSGGMHFDENDKMLYATLSDTVVKYDLSKYLK